MTQNLFGNIIFLHLTASIPDGSDPLLVLIAAFRALPGIKILNFRARSLVVSDMPSETKGSRLESDR